MITTNTRGVWVGTETIDITGGLFFATESSHFPERLPSPSFSIAQREDSERTGLAYNLQFDSVKCGVSLDISYSGRLLRHS